MFPWLHDYYSLLGGKLWLQRRPFALKSLRLFFHIAGTPFENGILLHLNIFSQFN